MRHDRVVRLARAPAATLSTILLCACTHLQPGTSEPLRDPTPGGALLTVENRHVQDMRVYLIRGSTPIPLGSVGTLERRTFTLSTALLGHDGTMRLMADPLGSRATYVSGVIPATPGDHVRWILAPSLALSSFSVRRLAGGL